MVISEIMTAKPVFVYEYELVHVVKRIMVENDIKHLPVLDSTEAVIGVVSDRDIKLHQAVSSDPDFHKTASISEIYRNNPYCVDPDTPLIEVLHHMRADGLGSALITNGSILRGIFTKTDACRILEETLRAN